MEQAQFNWDSAVICYLLCVDGARRPNETGKSTLNHKAAELETAALCN